MCKKLTIENCYKLAEERGGKCLSTEYKDNKTYMSWQCKNGHEWEAPLTSVKNCLSWCPNCAGLKKLTIENCNELAEKYGGKCLSTTYINSTEKYNWQCGKCNHQWSATYGNIYSGKWCPKCGNKKKADSQRSTIECCYKLAEKHGGTCLSTKYIKSNSLYEWKCGEHGHKWKATYGNVQQGKWCPYCNKKTEAKVRRELEERFCKKFPTVRHKYNGKFYEIDCYCEELKLGVEYDGEQHFNQIPYWGGEKALQAQKERDIYKDSVCKELGITLIRIPYTAKNNLQSYIEDVLRPIEVNYG